MSREMDWLAESGWTAEQALAWAKSKEHWPTRRWRVEGSRAGNSRLLHKKTADHTRLKYGGSVVELIPAPPPPNYADSDLYPAVHKGACPRCKAPIGAPCFTDKKKPRRPHSARDELLLPPAPPKEKKPRKPRAKKATDATGTVTLP